MKIVTICGAGIGSSGILKVNAERVLARLDIEAIVIAADVASPASRERHRPCGGGGGLARRRDAGGGGADPFRFD